MGCGGSKKSNKIAQPQKLAGGKEKPSNPAQGNPQNNDNQQKSSSQARNQITDGQKNEEKPSVATKDQQERQAEKIVSKPPEVKPQAKSPENHPIPANIQKTKEDLKSAAIENTEIKPIQKAPSIKAEEAKKSENLTKNEESKLPVKNPSQKHEELKQPQTAKNPPSQKHEEIKQPQTAKNPPSQKPEKQLSKNPPEDAKTLKNPPQKPKPSSSPTEIVHNQSLSDFKHPTTYNKIIWAKQRPSANDGHKPAVIISIEVNGVTEKLTFNDFPITSSQSKNIPKVVDCIAYILKTQRDIEEVKKINAEFKYVWSQGVICDNPQVIADIEPACEEMGMSIVNNMDEFMRKVYNDDRKLYILLKEVFMKIDKDSSGSIDMSELALATEQLGGNPNQSEIQQAMQVMDLNHDGKINFREFVYWWKRGRQGAISIQKMAGSFASKFAANVPGSIDLLRNIGIGKRTIDKTTYTKEFSLRVGEDFQDPKLSIRMLLGKSAKREQILHEANQALSFNMRESWVAIALTTKSGNASNDHSQLAQDTCKSLLNSFLASAYDGQTLQNALGANAQVMGNKVFVGAWIDLNNEKFDIVQDQIALVERVIRSPVDDYIDLSLQFKNGLRNLQSNEKTSNEMLFEAFRLKFTYMHWVKFLEMILAVRGKSTSADFFPLSFLMMSGNIDLRFKQISELPKIFSPQQAMGAPQANGLLDTIKQMMKSYISDTPYMANVVKEIVENFASKIEVVFRFNNLGLKLEIEADGLNEFYQALISG